MEAHVAAAYDIIHALFNALWMVIILSLALMVLPRLHR